MDVRPATYRVDEIRYPPRVAATEKELASRLTTSNRDQYVALVDLLGFSALVAQDWTRAVTVYSAIMAVAEHTYANHKSRWRSEGAVPATMQAFSDSILIIGTDLIEVGSLAQAIQSAALLGGKTLVRGGT